MNVLCFIFWLLAAAAPSPVPPPETVRVVVEGVAPSPEATRLAAFSSIRERVEGVDFAVLLGRYPAFSYAPSARTVDYRDTRLIEVRRLESGFFKGLLEVEAPADLIEAQKDLREYYGRGVAVVAGEGSALAARRVAQEAAINDAILSAVRARYPETSVSDRLTGRLYYLGSVRERIREGTYEILVRIRIGFDRD